MSREESDVAEQRSGGQRSGKPGGKPSGQRPPRSNRPSGASRGKPRGGPAGKGGGKAGGPRAGKPRRLNDAAPGADRPRREGPRDPYLPAHITADSLDPAVQNELRTLPEDLADRVGRHLAAADEALVDGDVTTARAHVAAAKRRAGRVAAVREAAGITAYLDGDYAQAVAELRAARRMTGSADLVPMLADCERGLGRPERALDLIREVDARKVDQETRVELALVGAGARADLGQVDAALLLLQGGELKSLPAGLLRARVEYAYADLLDRAGRAEEAQAWLRRAAASDPEGLTDAAERLAGGADLVFEDEYESGDEVLPGDDRQA